MDTLVHAPSVNLDEKYLAGEGRCSLQAYKLSLRLPLLRRDADANGLNTAGFISGYRGFPFRNL